MSKQRPSPVALGVIGLFCAACFGLLLLLWISFGGSVPLRPKGYEIAVRLAEAGQLTPQADVRISGVSVGHVRSVTVGRDGRARAVLALDADQAPLARDARATLRTKTLLGETYVDLERGHPRWGTITEGGALAPARVAPTVELDEILRTFDRRTRAALRTWIGDLAEAVDGRGFDLSDALATLPAFTEDTTRLLEVVDRQEDAMSALVRETGEVLSAVTADRGRLRSLVVEGERVFSATAARDRALAAAVRELAPFEAETRILVGRLDRFAIRTHPLVTQLRPAARQLSPALGHVSSVAPDLRRLLVAVGPAVDASAAGLPAVRRFLGDLRPTLGDLDPPLRQLTPMLDLLSRYRSELTAFFANATAAAGAFDVTPDGGRLHYLRTTSPLNPEGLAAYAARIGSNRSNPYLPPRAADALRRGLPVLGTTSCSAPVPAIAAGSTGALSALSAEVAPLLANIRRYAFGEAGTAAAPACRAAPATFPHVTEAR